MAKRFSKSIETRDELSTACNPKVMSICLSVRDATTSLYHCLQKHHQYLLTGASEQGNWASEASPTLGCSIEISRDIYMSVCRMSYVCRMSN